MRKRNAVRGAAALSLVAALLLPASSAAGTATAQVAAAAAVKVMPLGDSITGSPGCWRAKLWTRLQSNGYTNVDFVGTLGDPGCGVSYDGNNEGHGGYLATNIANQNQLPGWLAATQPDVVMMHLGTNDVWNNLSPSTILAAYGKLVDQMRASNPAMRILVAKILPMNPSGCSDCAQRVINLNNAIPGWAGGKSTSASPITVVDQWSGFSTGSNTTDGVHPNDSGNVKISDRWYPALTPLLTSGGSGPGSSGLLEGFESGSNGWGAGGASGGPWQVSEWAAQGSYSLKADVALGSGQSYSLSKVATQNLASGSTLRATVRAATWGTLGSGLTAKIYVKSGSGYTWYDGGVATITTGTGGTTLSLSLSGVAARSDVREIGVQFFAAANSSGTTSIYLDNVTVA
ncbi:lysophospholipase L1-like esterase [Actinoplanes tereljensis]|uniref:Uncharacterized protein n=1 Tax=Paractinoplanes tereljensis TaxID=571912 RepID=A0A919TZY9_9ACTN|nr:SGNH/GDSL hydrolase family protein [Actinoplanes tereljensis]GIF26765.1 hypothetical protein Ate02nite_94950 [Actinoplanes tereljensis]